MYAHQLHRVLALCGGMFAGFQRGMAEEGFKGRVVAFGGKPGGGVG